LAHLAQCRWVDERIRAERHAHADRVGQYVRIKLSGQRGQVVGVRYDKCRVRYESTIERKHVAGLVSQAESAVCARSYATDWFEEYELEFEETTKWLSRVSVQGHLRRRTFSK